MKKGFTLVELLVAIAIFSIIVVIAVGGFTNALRTQRQVAALIGAQSNASLALEQMAREIRTGYLFCHDYNVAAPSVDCFPHCVVSGPNWTCSDFVQFFNANTAPVAYERINNQLTRRVNVGTIDPITSDQVTITYLTFRLFGHLENDQWTPRITISMGARPSSTDPALNSNVLNFETTVSARGIDCNAVGC